ncbi:MAG: signal peptidase I [Thermomicrobia bacterium]|nr:signal peptidase I [Thermomicrobia bacterium]MCA1722730.1 signal peptidase I [Thermomicrobia bacterium]
MVVRDTESVEGADIADAPRVAEEPKHRSAARELIETLIIAALLFFGMRLLMPAVVVDGTSMVPSLQNGEHLLENRLAYRNIEIGGTKHYLFHAPQRGDIVVIEPPIAHDKPFIKRIIGLPGDTILIRDGNVIVNGVALHETNISAPPAYIYPADGRARTLGPDEYFVMGDNRNASEDSHIFGPIHSDAIMGKTWIAFWPRIDVGFLRRPAYPIPS